MASGIVQQPSFIVDMEIPIHTRPFFTEVLDDAVDGNQDGKKSRPMRVVLIPLHLDVQSEVISFQKTIRDIRGLKNHHMRWLTCLDATRSLDMGCCSAKTEGWETCIHDLFNVCELLKVVVISNGHDYDAKNRPAETLPYLPVKRLNNLIKNNAVIISISFVPLRGQLSDIFESLDIKPPRGGYPLAHFEISGGIHITGPFPAKIASKLGNGQHLFSKLKTFAGTFIWHMLK